MDSDFSHSPILKEKEASSQEGTKAEIYPYRNSIFIVFSFVTLPRSQVLKGARTGTPLKLVALNCNFSTHNFICRSISYPYHSSTKTDYIKCVGSSHECDIWMRSIISVLPVLSECLRNPPHHWRPGSGKLAPNSDRRTRDFYMPIPGASSSE